MVENVGPYTKKVMEHFRNPHNCGRIENADGIGKVGNVVCGDVMWMYITVEKGKDGKERIKKIKYETLGCVAAIATSSETTDLAKGKTLEEAMKIGKSEIVESLGGLPPVKIHCSVLASDALAEAIYDYLKRNGREIPEELEKKHEHIKKEKKEIEERYKEWVKMEEQMHEKK